MNSDSSRFDLTGKSRFWLLHSLLTCFSFITPSIGVAQSDVEAKGATPIARAKYLFDIGDYKNAILEYTPLLAEKPDDEFLNWRVGLCHLNQNINKSAAIPYLRKITEIKESFSDQILYDLGLAYMYNEQIDSAMLFFNKYKLKIDKPEKVVDVTRQIEFCTNARKFMENPLNVSFENLGDGINSEAPDLHPFTPMDESFLVFTTKRDKGVAGRNLDFDGYKPPDVFWSKLRYGEFKKAKGVGMTINTEFIEDFVGMSAFGDHMFYMIDNLQGFDDIWVSDFSGKRWEKGKSLGKYINTEEPEMAATCTPDGQTLFIARLPTLEPGFGGLDIYMAKKLPGDEWSIPVNLGPTINTQFDEMFPVISHDGKTLYFASQGHKSIGGYDIYKSEWDEEFQRWERPVNLGYPINTTMDDYTFCPTDNPRHAYVAQTRKGGFGDLDIYRVIFEEEEELKSVLVVDIEVVTGPEKEYLTFHEWKNTEEGNVKWFTDEYQPVDQQNYEFVETKKVEVKDGEEYEITIIGSFAGGEVSKYTPEKFPKDGGEFKWLDTRVRKLTIKKEGFVPNVNSIKGLDDLEVTGMATDAAGEIIGTYLPNYNTGKMVMVLEPGGSYVITIEAPGFKPIKEKVNVFGLGDYKQIITKKLKLVEEGIEYSE